MSNPTLVIQQTQLPTSQLQQTQTDSSEFVGSVQNSILSTKAAQQQQYNDNSTNSILPNLAIAQFKHPPPHLNNNNFNQNSQKRLDDGFVGNYLSGGLGGDSVSNSSVSPTVYKQQTFLLPFTQAYNANNLMQLSFLLGAFLTIILILSLILRRLFSTKSPDSYNLMLSKHSTPTNSNQLLPNYCHGMHQINKVIEPPQKATRNRQMYYVCQGVGTSSNLNPASPGVKLIVDANGKHILRSSLSSETSANNRFNIDSCQSLPYTNIYDPPTSLSSCTSDNIRVAKQNVKDFKDRHSFWSANNNNYDTLEDTNSYQTNVHANSQIYNSSFVVTRDFVSSYPINAKLESSSKIFDANLQTSLADQKPSCHNNKHSSDDYNSDGTKNSMKSRKFKSQDSTASTMSVESYTRKYGNKYNLQGSDNDLNGNFIECQHLYEEIEGKRN